MQSTNISHQDEESENKNYKDEGSTFQKIDNTHVTTSLADETALEYSHEDQKELATMADTEMGSMLPRNQKVEHIQTLVHFLSFSLIPSLGKSQHHLFHFLSSFWFRMTLN